MRSLVLSLIPILALAGCGQAPVEDVRDLTPAEAMARLAHADTAGFLAATRCGEPLTITVDHSDAKVLRWRVATDSGWDSASFGVRFEPVGRGIQAVVDLPQDPQGGEIYAAGKVYPKPMFEQPLRPAVAELVDSALDQRGFDATRLVEGRDAGSACTQARQLAMATPASPAAPKPAAQVQASFGDASASGAPANFGDPQLAAAPHQPMPTITFGGSGGNGGPVNPDEAGHEGQPGG
jgi:hypothetical protein